MKQSCNLPRNIGFTEDSLIFRPQISKLSKCDLITKFAITWRNLLKSKWIVHLSSGHISIHYLRISAMYVHMSHLWNYAYIILPCLSLKNNLLESNPRLFYNLSQISVCTLNSLCSILLDVSLLKTMSIGWSDIFTRNTRNKSNKFWKWKSQRAPVKRCVRHQCINTCQETFVVEWIEPNENERRSLIRFIQLSDDQNFMAN